MGDGESPPVLTGSGPGDKAVEAVKPAKSRRWLKSRGILVGFLVLLTCIAVLASTIAVWARRTVYDTDRFVGLVSPALSDPQVTNGLADYTTQQIGAALDLPSRVAEALPPQLVPLAGPLIAAAQNYVREQVREVYANPQFHDLLLRIVAAAHSRAVALIRGDTAQLPNVVVTSGEVRLNLLPIFREVLQRVAQGAAGLVGLNVTLPPVSTSEEPSAALERLAAALGRPLPENFGQLTIMSEDKLQSIQDGAKQVDRLLFLLLALTVVLLAAAIALSTHRRRTLVQLGIGVAVAFLLARVAIRQIQKSIESAIANPAGRRAAGDIMKSTFHDLRGIAVWVAVLAILAAIVAHLAGRPAWLRATGRRVDRWTGGQGWMAGLRAWAADHVDLLRVLGVGLAVLILLITGPDPVAFLVVGVVLALYLWGLAAIHRGPRAHVTASADPGESP